MPLGTKHTVVGLLTMRYGGLAVLPDDGGTWRLEVTRNYHKWLGKRVRVHGTRDGFDLLAVTRIELFALGHLDGPPTRSSRMWSALDRCRVWFAARVRQSLGQRP